MATFQQILKTLFIVENSYISLEYSVFAYMIALRREGVFSGGGGITAHLLVYGAHLKRKTWFDSKTD